MKTVQNARPRIWCGVHTPLCTNVTGMRSISWSTTTGMYGIWSRGGLCNITISATAKGYHIKSEQAQCLNEDTNSNVSSIISVATSVHLHMKSVPETHQSATMILLDLSKVTTRPRTNTSNDKRETCLC